MGPVGALGSGGIDNGGRVTVALTLAGWVLGMTVTALILGTPYLVFGYRNPSLHLILDTIDGSIALLLAYLLHGRFVRSQRLEDLLLAQGLFLLGVASLGLVLVVHLFDAGGSEVLNSWLPLTIRVTAALFIAAAALVDTRAAPPSWRRLSRVTPWLIVGVAFLILWWQREALPVALERDPPATAQFPVITGHPVLLGGQAVGAACFAIASLAFTLQAVRRRDELWRWLGAACALAAFARFNYLLFPSLYSDWLYTGDLLRTGSYLLLLVGAAREIREYWLAQAQAAVLEDRRRLARELHDGVVQELGYIRAETRSLFTDQEETAHIVDACDRALDEARAAVDALGRSADEPLGSVLHRAARQVAERYDGRLDVSFDEEVTVDAEQRHALVRITREAVSNALRHGRARCVRIQLCRDQGGHRLVVQDDGRGFDVDAVDRTSTGFGLTSMRERAQALPGALEIRSEAEGGTTVVVKW